MINKTLTAITYSTVHPKSKKARVITKAKALPSGMSAAAPYQDYFPIPGMTTQNDDAVGTGALPGLTIH